MTSSYTFFLFDPHSRNYNGAFTVKWNKYFDEIFFSLFNLIHYFTKFNMFQ